MCDLLCAFFPYTSLFRSSERVASCLAPFGWDHQRFSHTHTHTHTHTRAHVQNSDTYTSRMRFSPAKRKFDFILCRLILLRVLIRLVFLFTVAVFASLLSVFVGSLYCLCFILSCFFCCMFD